MDSERLSQLKQNWLRLIEALNAKFDADLDLQGVLFLIGVQELGKGPQSFSKNDKMGLMHIATCRLMSMYGYYELEGEDNEGWPHWKLVKKIPVMTLKEQDLLLKQSAIEYFASIDEMEM